MGSILEQKGFIWCQLAQLRSTLGARAGVVSQGRVWLLASWDP